MILIAEHDREVASRLERTLRKAGYTVLLAHDARSALSVLQDAVALLQLVLLDLGLPDPTGGELLRRLTGHSETARIPLLLLGDRREIQTHLGALGNLPLSSILVEPVSFKEMLQAVQAALRGDQTSYLDVRARAEHRRRELIRHLIVQGPDRLAFHVYRRLAAERMARTGRKPADSLTWAQIAEWARLEGLVTSKEADLLGRAPLVAGEGSSCPPALSGPAPESRPSSPQEETDSMQRATPDES